MPTIFDRVDARSAAAMTRTFGEPVVWRPMKARTGGVQVTVGAASKVDPDRPVLRLQAIPSWRPTVTPTVPRAGGGSVGNAELVLDFEASDFPNDFPRRGDRFELLDEPELAGKQIEVQRTIPDGTRVYCYCSVVA